VLIKDEEEKNGYVVFKRYPLSSWKSGGAFFSRLLDRY
jgi:hypothetical protein